VSQSKKANKQNSFEKSRSAQEGMKTSPVRSSRVAIDSAKESSDMRRSRLLTNLLRILAIVAVIAITFYVYSIRTRVEQFSALGYPGIFLIALLANATVLLPAPGVAVIYAMGAIFHPLGVGLAAGTGGALGELSGYLAGFSGQVVIERTDIYNRVQPWVRKYGGWAILALSAIPNPFFDVAGIAAGIARMPLRTFLVFTWIGQLIKMTLFALAGHYSVPLLTDFIK
jgi:membrane protein DedA with SNARE-associated domain